MSSPDIRAGVALLIAALSASGKSVIQNIEQIDRGYQYIDERLRFRRLLQMQQFSLLVHPSKDKSRKIKIEKWTS